MAILRRGWVVFGFLLAPAALAADVLHVCVSVQPYPPFMYPNKNGTVQVLINMAAEQSGVNIKYDPMPLAKCVEELHQGNVQASAAMGYTPLNASVAMFPMKKGEADSARSVGTARSFVYRLAGSKVNWDGTHFSELKHPLLFASGSTVFAEKAKALKIPYSDLTATFGKNLAKLLAGQGDAVIGFELEGKMRMEEPGNVGKFEVLPVPFTEAHYYLAFSKQYYEKNEAQAESLWAAVAKLKNAPAYQNAIKDIR